MFKNKQLVSQTYRMLSPFGIGKTTVCCTVVYVCTAIFRTRRTSCNALFNQCYVCVGIVVGLLQALQGACRAL